MFCPQCLVEYRPGFTHCRECEVALVDELPLASAAPGEQEDPFCAFWQGDDARLHAELCAVLDEAGIPHKSVRREDHLFNLKNFPSFRIGVPFSRFERAETAVKDAYETDSGGSDTAASLDAPALIPDLSGGLPKLPEARTPSEETVAGLREVSDEVQWEFAGGGIEVWSGKDTSLADLLVASLRENNIGVRRESSDHQQSLLVSSKQRAKAREIVKQVVEGMPPE